MDNHKPVSDRIRPILQAMERSIDSARRHRVKEPTAPLAATLVQAALPGHQSHSTPASQHSSQQHPTQQHQQLLHQPQPIRSNHESLSRPMIGSPTVTPIVPASVPGHTAPATGRLKAKPKRLNSPFSSPFDQAILRTQAG